MADATITGHDELKQALATLPTTLGARTVAALRDVARSTAQRVMANARANLAARTKGQGNTAAAIQVTEDAANRQFVVGFGLIQGRSSQLPLWLEWGFTQRDGRKHPGLHFMYDARKVEEDAYAKQCEAAALAAATESLE